jgi:molybdenum cofactor cytidylyltransferase
MTVAAVLLAGGLSRRFGKQDKLAMPLGGVALGLHAARTLSELPLDYRIVVTGQSSLDWAGFTIVTNDLPDQGMSHSLGLGVRTARELGASAVLVALADMPFVPPGHFISLLACCQGTGGIVCSGDGTRRQPPAIFGSDWFPALENLSGDNGARAMLDEARVLIAHPDELIDVDDSADLEAATAAMTASTRTAVR